jgi:hypothetical protein
MDARYIVIKILTNECPPVSFLQTGTPDTYVFPAIQKRPPSLGKLLGDPVIINVMFNYQLSKL